MQYDGYFQYDGYCLSELYFSKNFSLREIATYIGSNYSKVRRLFIKNNIRIKTRGEVKIGNLNPMFGKHHSDEIKKIISKANSGENNFFYGKSIPKETREKISKTLTGKFVKENNPNWKNGITPINHSIRTCPKYIDWRQAILIRDDYTCNFCNKRGGDLEVDHIKQFAKILIEYNISNYEDAQNCSELWNLNNGRTLCKKCHKETDTHSRKIIKLN